MSFMQDRISRLMHIVASIALVAMMLVVVADVALRFIFNTPVRGAYDLVSVFLLIMVFFGIGPVIARNAEILIDLFDRVAPATLIIFLRRTAAIGTLAVVFFLGWSMVDPAFDAYRYGGNSLELGFPVWWLWVVAFIGLAGILWCALLAFIEIWKNNGKHKS
jgi:TRAP-type C4-dicarboxylate transport system permease small subunit